MPERDTGFPPTIGRVAQRALLDNGFATVQSLTRVSADELLAIHGIGPKAVRILGEELASRGLALTDPV